MCTTVHVVTDRTMLGDLVCLGVVIISLIWRGNNYIFLPSLSLFNAPQGSSMLSLRSMISLFINCYIYVCVCMYS